MDDGLLDGFESQGIIGFIARARGLMDDGLLFLLDGFESQGIIGFVHDTFGS
jgi:hypothetical protein